MMSDDELMAWCDERRSFDSPLRPIPLDGSHVHTAECLVEDDHDDEDEEVGPERRPERP
jgi:hypothetical protein